MRINETIVRSGYFWLPETPDEKVYGTLTISNGGDAELEVTGLIGGRNNIIDDFPRIIGEVEKDGYVTLENCFYTSRCFMGTSKSHVCVNRVLSGVAYSEGEDVTFNTLSFSVDCLDQWVYVSGLKKESNLNGNESLIAYKLPDTFSYALTNGMKLQICFSYNESREFESATIQQKTYFKLISQSLKPLAEFTDIAYKITYFLCFAIGTTVSLKEMSATSSEIYREIGKDKKKYLQPIYIYYSSIPFSEKEPNIYNHQMLFTFANIKENTQKTINKWVDAYEIIDSAINLYFSAKMGAHKYSESKFLALAQCLEIYHRRTANKKLMENSTFEELVDTVIQSCPGEHIEWLKGRLCYGNEVNLTQRIKELVDPLKEYFGTSKERKRFVSSVVAIRNYLTHYSEPLRIDTADPREIWKLSDKMDVLFQFHLLKTLKIDEMLISSILDNNYGLQRMLKINRM